MGDGLTLALWPQRLAVCRLPAAAPLPPWFDPGAAPCALVRTGEELSLVAPQDRVPAGVQAERDWVALAVAGPLDFGLTGILARLSRALADAGVPIFALSTHDTDLILVPARRADDAVAALRADGHAVG